MSLVIFLIAAAFSADLAPATTPTPTATPFAQEEYVSGLLKERDQAGLKAALGSCTAAKSSFLGAQNRLATITAELSLPLDENLGAAQITYRRGLTTEKSVWSAQLSMATESAKAAGVVMVTARAKVNAINAELTRLNTASPIQEIPADMLPAGQPWLPTEFIGCFPGEVLPVHTNRQVWPTPPMEDDRPTLRIGLQ